jgi:hypothetical protein
VARLMKSMGVEGIMRAKPHRTTIPDRKAPCSLDKVNRQFRVQAYRSQKTGTKPVQVLSGSLLNTRHI